MEILVGVGSLKRSGKDRGAVLFAFLNYRGVNCHFHLVWRLLHKGWPRKMFRGLVVGFGEFILATWCFQKGLCVSGMGTQESLFKQASSVPGLAWASCLGRALVDPVATPWLLRSWKMIESEWFLPFHLMLSWCIISMSKSILPTDFNHSKSDQISTQRSVIAEGFVTCSIRWVQWACVVVVRDICILEKEENSFTYKFKNWSFCKFSYKVGRFLCLLVILCINNRFVSQNPFPN